MKVALVHDWLVSRRGGERVLEAIAELYPDAELFTLFYEPNGAPEWVRHRRVHTSFLDGVPGARRRHRHFLPLFPWAVQSLELSGFDLVISSSHCVAKGVRVPPGARHLSYVHAPMRYMWDRFDDYFGPGRSPLPVRFAARAVRPWLQQWDRASSQAIGRVVANSAYIAGRIREHWGREASVLHPPVDLQRFAAGSLERTGQGGYFLWVGALAPYKRIDLVLAAFARFNAPLWIAGAGQEAARLRGSLPANVKVLGPVADAELPALYRDARALVFPGEEDFGITPLEAQASGRPVIAYGRGGVLETVSPRTGLFFEAQTVDALLGALRGFDAFEAAFRPEEARAQAAQFTKARFQEGFSREVEALLSAPPRL